VSSEDFLSLFSRNGKQSAFKLGTIPSGYISGKPQVIFDGESQASAKAYTYLSTYTPSAGDRVLIALTPTNAVILGKVLIGPTNPLTVILQRKNILHNWDFRNPVNQRGQTVYTGSTPTIDRWKLMAVQHTAEIVDGGIKIIASGSASVNNAFGQVIENYKAYEGKEITVSCNVLENTTEQGIALRYNNTVIGSRITGTGVFSGSIVLPSSLSELVISMQFWDRSADNGNYVVIESVKMEVGLGSTLANDHPADYGEQLALCKRFYRLWTTEQARTEALKEVGLMRLESPMFGTINIGGTTYYYANAEL
jgi:hypothetical protein